MKTIFNSLLIALLFLPSMLMAQNTITGQVTEQISALPLPGVNVVVKNTSNGTATDFDGNFQLAVNNGDILEFSYIGYITKEITYTGQTAVNVNLVKDAAQLDEVVIIGYGSVKREDLTGSVDVVSSKDFNKGAIISTDQLLQGKAAGVRITTDGGSPDSTPNIRIRGGSSLSANNSPLIVIDGIPLGNQNPAGVSNPLSLVNPNDVESFTILKDASATAIYGSRASNGVIIITTKKGTTGDVKFNFSSDATVSTAGEGLDIMTSEEYVRFIQEYHPTFADRLGVENGTASTSETIASRIGNRNIYNTDWREQILRTAHSSNTNFSARANLGEKLPFRVSLGYVHAEGLVKTDDYERLSGSIKFSPRLLNDNLKIDANAKITLVDKNAVDADGALGGALRFDPTKPIFDANSPFEGYYMNTAVDGNRTIIDGQSNPLALLTQRERPEEAFRFLGNIELDYKLPFFPELSAVVNLGLDASRSKIEERFIGNALQTYQFDASDNGIFNPGVHYRERQHVTNNTFDAYLKYAKVFEESIIRRFDVQAGYAYQNFKTDGNKNIFDYSERVEDGPIGQRFQVIDPNNPTDRYYNVLNLQSFFGRTNIDIAEQLLITLSLRADASSLFLAENRWGYFPAAAVAWKLGNLKFIKHSNLINDLKLRVGYGKTGQQDITDSVGFYPSLPLFTAGDQNSQYLPGVNLYSASAFDEDLTWEKTTTYNIGLDFNFLKNSIISGSVDFFKRETTDLLSTVVLPPGQGLSDTFTKNVGSTESEGFELNLNLDPIQSDNFNLSFNSNIAYAISEVTDLDNITTLRIGGSLRGTGSNLLFNNLGEEPYLAGVFKQIYDTSGNPIPGAFADLNGDNVITEDDKYFEPVRPNWTFGFGLNINYRNWDLGTSFRGQLDGKIYNLNELNLGFTESALPNNNTSISNVLNFYDAAANPVFENVNGNIQFSDYYLRDAGFMRCENIVLGYRFKDNFINNTNMRIYASVNNPFIITEYDGQDPENFEGIDGSFYPRPTAYTLGINLDF